MKITHHLKIHGLVQGVFFRESMSQKAKEFGITGWVRNRIDGTVEAVIQGSPLNIENMLAWCRRGPELARVAHVEISEVQGEFDSFDKLPTT